ncbi:MAG: E3 ubiquitin protein ligase [archaeon]|nr:E3 ubiquitin protein ligase [archaeon]
MGNIDDDSLMRIKLNLYKIYPKSSVDSTIDEFKILIENEDDAYRYMDSFNKSQVELDFKSFIHRLFGNHSDNLRLHSERESFRMFKNTKYQKHFFISSTFPYKPYSNCKICNLKFIQHKANKDRKRYHSPSSTSNSIFNDYNKIFPQKKTLFKNEKERSKSEEPIKVKVIVEDLRVFVDCPICFEKFEDPSPELIKLECGHKFCSECLIEHAKEKIKNAEVPVKCPESTCSYKLTRDEINKYLPSDYFHKYIRFMSKKQILNMPGAVECPIESCGSYAINPNYLPSGKDYIDESNDEIESELERDLNNSYSYENIPETNEHIVSNNTLRNQKEINLNDIELEPIQENLNENPFEENIVIKEDNKSFLLKNKSMEILEDLPNKLNNSFISLNIRRPNPSSLFKVNKNIQNVNDEINPLNLKIEENKREENIQNIPPLLSEQPNIERRRNNQYRERRQIINSHRTIKGNNKFNLKRDEPIILTCKRGHKFCSNCLLPPHPGQKCHITEEKDFSLWKEGRDVRKCPKCSYLIEKSDGCNHMTCGRCGYQFCWICGGKYSSNHFSNPLSPCYKLMYTNKRSICSNCFLRILKMFFILIGIICLASLVIGASGLVLTVASSVYIAKRRRTKYRFCYIICCFFIGIAMIPAGYTLMAFIIANLPAIITAIISLKYLS